MKILHIQNVDASDLNAEKINIPSDQELKIAGLLHPDGSPLVSFWYEPTELFYSQDHNKLRNRANLDVLTRVNLNSLTPAPYHNFKGATVDTANVYTSWERKREGDWTIACVVKVNPSLGKNKNTSLFGFDPSGGVNVPSLNFTRSGVIRAIGGLGNTPAILFSATDVAPKLFEELSLIVISQREGVGTTLRVNGLEKTRGVTTQSVKKSTGKKLRFLGTDVTSAALYGEIGTCLLLDSDLNTNPEALKLVETYLMSKYGIQVG